jgi:hypothetical protein
MLIRRIRFTFCESLSARAPYKGRGFDLHNASFFDKSEAWRFVLIRWLAT